MDTPRRSYESPLREAAAQATRARIVEAALGLMVEGPEGEDIPLDAIAARAGVERRTLFRHFATREALFQAVFAELNTRLGLPGLPRSEEDLRNGPVNAFAAFDGQEHAIRAAIHSRAGRAMRAGTIADRRAAFEAALARRLGGLAPDKRVQVLALVHLLYSAPAWEVLKDYGGLDGPGAGRAAQWALSLVLGAITTKGENDGPDAG